MTTWREDPASVRPMLATTADAPLESPALVYEPKYDGIRALVAVAPPPRGGRGGTKGTVQFWSRLGNEKTAQFPELVDALTAWAKRLDRPVLLDGEIVALDEKGVPVGFQNLQGRIHLKTGGKDVAGDPSSARIAIVVFDIL